MTDPNYPAPTEAERAIIEDHIDRITQKAALGNAEHEENGDKYRVIPEEYAARRRNEIMADTLEGSQMREAILRHSRKPTEQGRH